MKTFDEFNYKRLNISVSDIRLNNAVIRGEIDNTRRGIVSAKFWLFGKEKPLEIKLEGDCLRDLAGCHFQFKNNPVEQFQKVELDWSKVENGFVGDITASARLCMHRPNDLGGYDGPEIVNVLRFEFFTEFGRILLESYDFTSTLISNAWQMSISEEFGQKAANFATWQGHIERNPRLDIGKDAQHLANLYDEIHQRFADNFDFDLNEAALMGWNGIISALADESESTNTAQLQIIDDLTSGLQELLSEDILSDEEWDSDEWSNELGIHPLLESIQELIEDFEVQAANLTFPRGRQYQRLINTLDDIEEGLTGLLNPTVTSKMSSEICMIGCREYLGKMMIAFHHFSRLLDITETTEGRKELLFLRDEMLDLREGISALRFELNNL